MLILARVCADFYDKNRNLLHRITPRDLNLFHEAPESIKPDPLFQMLVDDGSIKFPADAAKNRALEQDPYAGTTPDGREIRPKVETKPKTETKTKTTVKAPVKTEAKAEEKAAEKPTETK
ncbi:MAG: hypothetical protein IJQ88_10315 [Clostridia bacterium]|nr:hypothetical protein [Clostridia bacterium]MBQ9401763.1 hypothetical protein [Clostridia bacterium]